MANRRRIAALELLNRLKQLELEQAGERIAAIRSEQALIEGEKSVLRTRAATEGQVVSAETLPFVADFLASLDQRRAQLDSRLNELESQAAGLENALMKAFVEAKTQSTVLQQACRSFQLQQARAVDAETMEVGQAVYLRNARAERGET
ncbi:MAG: hypothetical protein ACWA47_01230 [Brevirhabdus sp.]